MKNVHTIDVCDMTNVIDGIATSIWFQGCSKHCVGCQNGHLLAFKESNYSRTDVLRAITSFSHRNGTVSLLGGDPLEFPNLTHSILIHAKELGLTTILWTGVELEEVPRRIIDYVDYIKVGKYEKSKHCNKRFYGSENQKMYRVENGKFYADPELNK